MKVFRSVTSYDESANSWVLRSKPYGDYVSGVNILIGECYLKAFADLKAFAGWEFTFGSSVRDAICFDSRELAAISILCSGDLAEHYEPVPSSQLWVEYLERGEL